MKLSELLKHIPRNKYVVKMNRFDEPVIYAEGNTHPHIATITRVGDDNEDVAEYLVLAANMLPEMVEIYSKMLECHRVSAIRRGEDASPMEHCKKHCEYYPNCFTHAAAYALLNKLEVEDDA